MGKNLFSIILGKEKKLDGLTEKKGVEFVQSINPNPNTLLRSKKADQLSSSKMADLILEGNITALSQSITLIESDNEEHQKLASEILKTCLSHSGKSQRIGVTGVPGVGKSTFIEAFGNLLASRGKKIAILSIDPSSPQTKGSILGDKTRMETLVKNENVYIRPTPSGKSLGGVARKTRETIVLCESAGFDTILIETVGVGQSETAVHSMVDFFLLLKLAGAGDELQGVKRGIIELADLIAINKADGDNIKAAKQARQDFRNALHLFAPKASGWQPKVLLCSAINITGIDKIADELDAYFIKTRENGYFVSNRNKQQEYWLKQTIEDSLKHNFYKKPNIEEELSKQLKLLKNQETTAFEAAKYLLGL